MKLSKNKIMKLLKGKNITLKLRKKKPVKKGRSLKKRPRTARNGVKKNQRTKTMKRMYGGIPGQNKGEKDTSKTRRKKKRRANIAKREKKEHITRVNNPLLTEKEKKKKKKKD